MTVVCAFKPSYTGARARSGRDTIYMSNMRFKNYLQNITQSTVPQTLSLLLLLHDPVHRSKSRQEVGSDKRWPKAASGPRDLLF